ncbi:MAG: FG-GAP repeat protein [Ignavibacteria bacterium]|nr:FG-GAP repeat protein [Ignavibacteria bacterium]
MNQSLFFLAFVFFLNLSLFNGNNKKENYESKSVTPILNASLTSSQLLKRDEILNQQKISGTKDPSWSGKAISTLRNEEYNISYNSEVRAYQSPNRANNIRFTYNYDGFSAKTRENRIPLFDLSDKLIRENDKKYKSIREWELRMIVNGFTRGSEKENLVSLNSNELLINKNKATIEDDNMRIEYTNDERGMRQDFIIKNKPAGNGNLKLQISAETKLSLAISDEELIFSDDEGKEMMKYSSLKVFDANGKTLNASFINNDNYSNDESRLFAISVDDKDAAYPVTIDPISSSPDWTSESNQAESGFGYSVSTAGDINNDGYDDVIIGSPFYDNGQTNEGRVFVYYGSIIGLLPIPTWTFESNQDNAQLGWTVSNAGDVNGDGFSDIIAGANYYTNDQQYEGRAYVFYGSVLGLSSTPNKILESNQANSNFGYSVSVAGDLNNDGFSDVIVGAPLFDNGEIDEGKTFVYYGSATGPSTAANMTGESNQATSFFGISVSPAGDINGDGFDDVIIGSNTFDNPQRDQGCSFIYYGSATGISSNHNWKSGSINAWFSYLGTSVYCAGDVNGDGYDDVISGATGFDNGMITDEGKIFLYYGSASGLTLTANWTAEIYQPFARFGNSVCTAGDVNNDGYSDILVGSYLFDNGHTDEGRVYVYYGSSVGLTAEGFWTAEVNQTYAYFGYSVSKAGDVNGDGYSDIIVGSYLYDNGQSNEGAAFVYYGAPGGPKTLVMNTFIQGLYNDVTNTSLTDTVKVYLRNSFPPYALVDSTRSKINSSGSGIYSFMNASNGVNYYIQVSHKNSIATWSAAPISFSNNFKSYDFTTASSKAYGQNMTQVDASPVAYAIYSGDINLDQNIELEDMLFVQNDAKNFVTGNVITDLNGDFIVDAKDLLITTNNTVNFVSVAHP